MKRPVSLVASLVLATLMAASCSGAKVAGKADLADACMKRMGHQQAKCDCYVETVQASLTPEQFAVLTQGAYDARDFGGSGWLPAKVQSDPAISNALNSGTQACFEKQNASR